MPQPPSIPNNRPGPLVGAPPIVTTVAFVAPPRREHTGPLNVSPKAPSTEKKGGPIPLIVLPDVRNASSFLVSLIVHCVLLIVLALINPANDKGSGGVTLVVAIDGETPALNLPENLAISIAKTELDTILDAASNKKNPLPQFAEAPAIESPFAAPEPVSSTSLPAAETRTIPAESLLIRSSLPLGGGIEGRTQQQRARMAGERGGTPGSENAVELALEWLAQHQRADGSWCLKLTDDPCKGRCTHPGLTESNTGATALALLPFLGAGYSHHDGPYKDVVRKGLYYLTTRMVETEHGGDLTENVTMYAQGISALALCEGLAMTNDPNLRPPAQKAIDFICYAQHPKGGWRYFPGQPGDTTVTGWQVMALKSARLAKLNVPSQTTQLVHDFLDSVQDADGAFYGYLKSDKQPGATSVGLLLRMYSGWDRDDPRLQRGITYLAHLGPSKTDVYFDYYATQVMNHHGGSRWEHWNSHMRDHLVATQSKSGHERGSWFFADKHGSVGGRLYTTAMCAMILEVYYRYLPLYGDDAIQDSF